MLEPLWLNLGRKEIGTKEVPGPGDNPTIAKYWDDAGIGDVAMGQDEVPWCAAFVGAMLKRAQMESSGKANARSYEKWGRDLRVPVLGCVCVLSRPPSTWQGHVGFVVGADRERVQLLGGNQGDSVSIAGFPRARVVCFRWPSGGLIQPEWVAPPIISGQANDVSDR